MRRYRRKNPTYFDKIFYFLQNNPDLYTLIVVLLNLVSLLTYNVQINFQISLLFFNGDSFLIFVRTIYFFEYLLMFILLIKVNKYFYNNWDWKNKTLIIQCVLVNILLLFVSIILIWLFLLWIVNQHNLISILYLWRCWRWVRLIFPIDDVEWFWARYKETWDKSDSDWTKSKYKTFQDIFTATFEYDDEDLSNPIHQKRSDIVRALMLKMLLIFFNPFRINLTFLNDLPWWVDSILPGIHAHSIVPWMIMIWCLSKITKNEKIFRIATYIFAGYWVFRTVINLINPFNMKPSEPFATGRDENGYKRE